MAEPTLIRAARPEDHARIVAVADDWWGRPVSGILPRLFLDHFHPTSLVADAGEDLAGFVVGFFSPGDERTAYIHFTGVAPDQRRTGLARELYRRFFAPGQGGRPDPRPRGHLTVQHRLHRLPHRDGLRRHRPAPRLRRPRPGPGPLRTAAVDLQAPPGHSRGPFSASRRSRHPS